MTNKQVLRLKLQELDSLRKQYLGFLRVKSKISDVLTRYNTDIEYLETVVNNLKKKVKEKKNG